MPEKPTDLYRHYDADGQLLYVGISLSAIARLKQHQDASHWSHQIRRVEIEPFADRGEALAAEWAAIQNENPLHNRAGKIKRTAKPAYETKRDGVTIHWTRAALALAEELEGPARPPGYRGDV